MFRNDLRITLNLDYIEDMVIESGLHDRCVIKMNQTERKSVKSFNGHSDQVMRDKTH